MHKPFEIRADWPNAPKAGEMDVAHLSIRAHGAVLTQLADAETGVIRDHLRASAVSLALWLADNWWRLRFEPLHDSRRPNADWRLRHELSSASGGTAWPPLMIYGTGERVVIAAASGFTESRGPVRYLDIPIVYAVMGDAFESGLDSFFKAVGDVCLEARDGRALETLLQQLWSERADPEIAAWRAMEARLGYDPDEAPEGLIERLGRMEKKLGEQAVEEAAAAAPGEASAAILQTAIDASEASKVLASLTYAQRVDRSLFETERSAWQWGEAAAAIVRSALGLTHEPLGEDAISTLLGARWEDLKSAAPTASRLPYAARRPTAKGDKLALQTRTGIDRRFELARILGDAVWDEASAFGVISRAKTERQKFQRAFAQGLLCPFAGVRRHVDLADPTDDQIDEAARIYQVRSRVIEGLLVNKGVLPRASVFDWHEAA